MSEQFDFLVIGGGVSGLFFAIKAARYGTVAILTKRSKSESATNYAQGGIAAVLSEEDSHEAHYRDTWEAGCGLNHPDAVDVCVRDGSQRIHELMALGVRFSLRNGSSKLDLTREGGHSKRRVAHYDDLTGREIERALLVACEDNPNIEFFPYSMAIDLITEQKLGRSLSNRCLGAYVLLSDGSVETFLAKVTVLATGGAGKVYLYTSNPDVSTGDGVAMAYRAGARIANMEFYQFHPTCLFHPQAKSFLISESLRGEGGILRLRTGQPFMEKYHSKGALAPRDIVARAIDAEMKRSGEECVFLDMTHLSKAFLMERFPHIYSTCKEFGIDITAQPIPVVPAAHYMCGGVTTDLRGQTTVAHLLAIGEVACTGLHGANRLASNSLLEGVVFAARAAEYAKDNIGQMDSLPTPPAWDPGQAVDSDESVVVTQNWDELRRFMWNYVGIVRTDKRLARARRRLELLREEIKEYYWRFKVDRDTLELRNIADVAMLIVECAMRRRESRGLHFTLEFPKNDDARWLQDTEVLRAELEPVRG